MSLQSLVVALSSCYIFFRLLYCVISGLVTFFCFFFQAEDGIRDLVRSRGLGDVYKRQLADKCRHQGHPRQGQRSESRGHGHVQQVRASDQPCLLYTSDAADERSSVDLGGRRIIKKKKKNKLKGRRHDAERKII